MTKATPAALAAMRWLRIAAIACVAALPARAVRAQAAPVAKAGGFMTLTGTVIDSLHDAPLAHATVIIEGTGRSAVTDGNGNYRIDSIPPGQHRVVVMHPLLDTLGVTLRTAAYPFVGGETHSLDVGVPSAKFVATHVCSPAMQARGPAVLLGFVRDPDTGAPATGAKVQLVYTVTDVIGRKSPRVPEAPVDSAGMYRICGLPSDMSGKVQLFRNGVSSGEVPIEITNGYLATRSFSIVSKNAALVAVKNDSGKVRMVARGSARVTGRVLNGKGQPLRDARVALQGGGVVALTNSNGQFTLDSLPSGTQAIEVRKLGYSVAEQAVELSSAAPTTTTVTMSDAIPLLATMRVEAASDKALSDLGYLERKQTGMGYYMDGKMINHASAAFSDVLRNAPGLRIDPAGDGRSYVVTDSRSSSGGCVNFIVDGNPWTQMTPGDIDQYVRPDELVAVEVYHGSSTPAQFQSAGQSGCATIVAWTQAKISTMKKR
jgi:hypothetical protein